MKKLKTYFYSWFFEDGQDKSNFFVPKSGIDKINCRITPDEENDVLEFRLLDPEKNFDLNSGIPYKVKYPEGYLVKSFFSELLYSNIHYSYSGVYCSLFCGGDDIKEVASVYYYNKKMVSSDSEHLFCFGSQNPFIEPELVYWSLRFWIMQNPQIANVHHFNLLNDIFPRTFSANYPGFGLTYSPYINTKELEAIPSFIDLKGTGTERYTKHFLYTNSLFLSVGNKFRFVEERPGLCLDNMNTLELKEAFLHELFPLLSLSSYEASHCIDISPSLLKQAMQMIENQTLLYNLTKIEKKAVVFLSEACMKNSPTLLSIYEHILNKRCNNVYYESLTSFAIDHLENCICGPKVAEGRGGKQDIDTLKKGIYQARKLVESRTITTILIPYLIDIVKGLR